MLIEIKHRFTGAVLFPLECGSLKLCVEAAVKSRADLRDAYLSGADLRRADHVQSLGQPNGWFAFTYFYKGFQRVQVGCKNFTLKKGRDYWKGKDDRAEVMASIDYAEAIGKLRKWGEK